MAACHQQIRDIGQDLLAGTGNPARIDITDLLTVVNGVAWAHEHLPADPARLDRLLDIAVGGRGLS